MLITNATRCLRALCAICTVVAYVAGISQLLPAMLSATADSPTAASACPTVMSCAVTAAYGPCCCLTSTAPADLDTPGLMAVGCALPDEHGAGTTSLPAHTATHLAFERAPGFESTAPAWFAIAGRSILLSPDDEVPRLRV